ncbi:MAG: hypothetical protein JO242_01245 [Streptosporangiaceae bacterium]|nr:hypothetical protein [Streptosporangiaceae bacterium]
MPLRPRLPALRGRVADAADLVPFRHPAHLVLVCRVGRRGDHTGGGDGEVNVALPADGNFSRASRATVPTRTCRLAPRLATSLGSEAGEVRLRTWIDGDGAERDPSA